MRFIRERTSGSPNVIVGIFLLVLLGVFAGPTTLPNLVARVVPGFYEGLPCAWVRAGTDRANHQSLLGRGATNPLRLSVRTSAISDAPDGVLTIQIVVINNSLGSVPFVFNPQQVIVGDNGSSGIGLIFSPGNTLTTGFNRPADGATIPENSIRVLGPRQRCVVTVEFPNGNVLIDPSIRSGTAEVSAYYRSNSAGQVLPTPGVVATPIYRDQGLQTGYLIRSDPVRIPLAGG